ncbi:MAG: hypothetical protein ABI556_06060, partial [Gemmatimonadales bacterium]
TLIRLTHLALLFVGHRENRRVIISSISVPSNRSPALSGANRFPVAAQAGAEPENGNLLDRRGDWLRAIGHPSNDTDRTGVWTLPGVGGF